MTTAELSQEKAPSKVKKGAMETTMTNYSFPTIGEGGVVIAAESQEEANKAAAKLQEDMKKQGEEAKKA